jgi:hypothetical protein
LPAIADSAVELDALAQMDHADQKAAITLVQQGRATTVREARGLSQSNRSSEMPLANGLFERRWQTFLKAWGEASLEQRFRVITTLWDSLDELTRHRLRTRFGDAVMNRSNDQPYDEKLNT